MLLLLHPKVAYRSCEECERWQYNEETGQVEQFRGADLKRIGKTACRTHKGCPVGTPENQQRLTEQNQAAYEHYTECKATGRFPDDPIVKRNAATITRIENAIEKSQMDSVRALMIRAARR